MIKTGDIVRHVNGLPGDGVVMTVVGYGCAGGEYVRPQAQVRWRSNQSVGWYPLNQLFNTPTGSENP